MLEKNLNALRKNDFSLAARIEKARPDGNYRVLPAENGYPTMLSFDRGKPVYLHSRYDPVREALAWSAAQGFSPDVSLAVFGFGLGYHVAALLKHLSPGQQLRVYQLGTGPFRKALESVCLADLLSDSRLSLVVEDDQAVLAADLAVFLGIGAQLLIYGPGLRAIPRGPLWEALNEWRVKKASLIRFGGLLEENFKANLPLLSNLPLINEYFGRLFGHPLLLAAGGPSLDGIVPYLRNTEGIFVLAAGTALAPLIKAGIRPDMVMVTDPQPVVAAQLTMLDPGTPLIVLPTVSPDVIKGRFSQLVLALQEGCGPAEAMAAQKGVELIATGGSVSTTALDIAIRMGADPIMLAGLDLAYPGGKMHASGTVHGDNVTMGDDELTVIGNDGAPVATNSVLNIYRRWIERRIERENGREFINLSPSGARIANTKLLAPAFLLKYCNGGGRRHNYVRA